VKADSEIADAVELIKQQGLFAQVRHKEIYEAMLGGDRVTIEVFDAGTDSEPRFAVAAKRSDGRRAYSGIGDTLAEAIGKVEWGHLLT
jgi:hypothetical protein